METKENDYKISPAFIKAAKLRELKKDYGSIKESFPFGDLSFAQMVHIKAKRLVNLADQSRMGIEPNCESIEDSLLDIINYASYWWEYRKEVLDD